MAPASSTAQYDILSGPPGLPGRAQCDKLSDVAWPTLEAAGERAVKARPRVKKQVSQTSEALQAKACEHQGVCGQLPMLLGRKPTTLRNGAPPKPSPITCGPAPGLEMEVSPAAAQDSIAGKDRSADGKSQNQSNENNSGLPAWLQPKISNCCSPSSNADKQFRREHLQKSGNSVLAEIGNGVLADMDKYGNMTATSSVIGALPPQQCMAQFHPCVSAPDWECMSSLPYFAAQAALTETKATCHEPQKVNLEHGCPCSHEYSCHALGNDAGDAKSTWVHLDMPMKIDMTSLKSAKL